MIKEKPTLVAQISNFAVWLGSGCFLALQFMRLDILVFDDAPRLLISKILSYIVIACVASSGYRLSKYLYASKSVIKDAIRKEIEQENSKDE